MRKRWLRLAALPVALSFVAVSVRHDPTTTTQAGGDTTAKARLPKTPQPKAPAAEGTAAEGTAAEGTAAEGTAGEGDGATTGDFGGAEVTIIGSESDDPSVIAINTPWTSSARRTT